MVLYLAVFFTSAILLGALTFDFARLSNLKAELQNSADAAAHAGVARMIAQGGCNTPGDLVLILNQAIAYALANPAMQGAVTVSATMVGDWIPGSGFVPVGLCAAGVDAIRVEVNRPSGGLFMAILGVTAPVVRADAIGWMCPTAGLPPNCPSGPGLGSSRPVLVR